MFNIYLTMFLILLLLSGCNTAAKINNDGLADELKADNAPEITNQKEETVLARINGEKITMSEYNGHMKRLSTFEKAKYRGEEGHKKFLNELIRRKLMLQNARKMALDKDSEVQKKIEILTRDVIERVLVETLIKREVGDKVVVTDKEAKEYYDEHEDEFKENEQIRIRHILVRTEEDAQQILQELKAGINFAELAKEKSIDQKTANLGGDLGYFERGRLLPEFEQVCFGLKVGEVSEVVKTKFGYHIIKLEDEKESSIKEFYEVKEEIKKKLISNKQREKYQEWILQIEENAKIEMDEDFFRK